MSVEASMKIKEIIVVEGKDDTVAIKRAVDADTIETNGSAIGDHVIEQVKLAQRKTRRYYFYRSGLSRRAYSKNYF